MELETKLEERQKDFTTLLTLLQLVEAHIKSLGRAKAFGGLTSSEVKPGYLKVAARYHRNTQFFPSYLQRHAVQDGLYKEISAGRYAIKPELLGSAGVIDLARIKRKIHRFLAASVHLRTDVLNRLDELLNEGDLEKQKAFLIDRLTSTKGHQGQNFEIISFSILSVYFSSLGFTLQRFSVTFANDGGMDFICGEGVYMVTASPTESKITTDLAKLPGTKRVLVGTAFGASLRCALRFAPLSGAIRGGYRRIVGVFMGEPPAGNAGAPAQKGVPSWVAPGVPAGVLSVACSCQPRRYSPGSRAMPNCVGSNCVGRPLRREPGS
jgi:hypothetical protein